MLHPCFEVLCDYMDPFGKQAMTPSAAIGAERPSTNMGTASNFREVDRGLVAYSVAG